MIMKFCVSLRQTKREQDPVANPTHLPKTYVIGILRVAEIGHESVKIWRNKLRVFMEIPLQIPTKSHFVKKKVQVAMGVDHGDIRSSFSPAQRYHTRERILRRLSGAA